jgi:flavin-dependent trigonelline monooxygenase, reductase component
MVGRASGTLARVEGPDCLHSIPMPVDRDLFRRTSGSFPTGATIITTRHADGAPKGLTTQSFKRLSTPPPPMLVSIDKTALTLTALERSHNFVVDLPKHGAEDVAMRVASKSEDTFASVPSRASDVACGVSLRHPAPAVG